MKRILLFIVFIFSTICLFAQTKESTWVEREIYEVPFNAETNTITFDNGEVRHYLVLEGDYEVYIRNSSFEKFKNKEAKLLLVEWVNIKTGSYKYTTRIAKEQTTNNKANIQWKSLKDL